MVTVPLRKEQATELLSLDRLSRLNSQAEAGVRLQVVMQKTGTFYVPEMLDGVKVLEIVPGDNYTQIVATNSFLQADSPGLPYCKSKDVKDIDPDGRFIPWGSTLHGYEDSNGWIRLKVITSDEPFLLITGLKQKHVEKARCDACDLLGRHAGLTIPLHMSDIQALRAKGGALQAEIEELSGCRVAVNDCQEDIEAGAEVGDLSRKIPSVHLVGSEEAKKVAASLVAKHCRGVVLAEEQREGIAALCGRS